MVSATEQCGLLAFNFSQIESRWTNEAGVSGFTHVAVYYVLNGETLTITGLKGATDTITHSNQKRKRDISRGKRSMNNLFEQ